MFCSSVSVLYYRLCYDFQYFHIQQINYCVKQQRINNKMTLQHILAAIVLCYACDWHDNMCVCVHVCVLEVAVDVDWS